MDEIISFYRQFGTFTYPGGYLEKLKADLPSEVRNVGLLVRQQTIHRVVLKNGNTSTNSDLRYGDMTKVPWWRQCEDDNLVTAATMIAELYRRDARGFVSSRAEKDRLVVTCRFVSILMASLLKIKGIPCRVRSGFNPNFSAILGEGSHDHWWNEYWDGGRWVIIDVDGSLEDLPFDPYDIPRKKMDYSADAWLEVRQGKKSAYYFHNACGISGLQAVIWELFYDFNCLMNNEIIYFHKPSLATMENFPRLSEKELREIDELARLLQNPDENFAKLQKIWKTKKEYRLLSGGLL